MEGREGGREGGEEVGRKDGREGKREGGREGVVTKWMTTHTVCTCALHGLSVVFFVKLRTKTPFVLFCYN